MFPSVSLLRECHCEELCDEAISKNAPPLGLLRPSMNPSKKDEGLAMTKKEAMCH